MKLLKIITLLIWSYHHSSKKTVYAIYVQRENKIYCINSDIFYNPFIVLHEFYHHIRTKGGIHKGSEKYANMYAKSFIDSYKKIYLTK